MSRSTLYNLCLALMFATQATSIALVIFMFSRGDHDMKLLALGAAISQTSALMSTASTMLVGRDVTQRGTPADLPDGSIVSESTTSTIQTPPITPEPSPAPESAPK